MTAILTRPISAIARDIDANWSNVYFGAVPYLAAMHSLTDMESMYYEDTADDILIYFLSNATTWRGDKAREIKAEIKSLMKQGRRGR